MKSKLKPRTPRHHRKAYSSLESNSSLKKEINFFKKNKEIISKPRTPRRRRKASSSSSSVSNSSLKKEINFLKRNQEIMRKAFNKLNNDMKEIKKLLKDIENNNSIPSGMYL